MEFRKRTEKKRNETHSPPPFGRENQRLIFESVPYLLSKPETL